MKIAQLVSLAAWLSFIAYLWFLYFGVLSFSSTWSALFVFFTIGFVSGVVSLEKK